MKAAETEPTRDCSKMDVHCYRSEYHIHLTVDFVINSSLFKPPGLVLTCPLRPEFDGGPRCRVSVVGQVSVDPGSHDEDSAFDCE